MKDIAKKDTDKKEIANRAVAQSEVAQSEVAQSELAQKEAAEKEAAEKEVAEKEVAEKEVAEKEVAEKEVAEKEVAEKEVAEKEVEVISESRCFDGRQLTYQHRSEVCNCMMRFAVFLPPAAERRDVPAVYWLSGLTCTEENFSLKAGAQRYAARLGLALIIPDTSPRGVNIPGQDEYMEVGTGAGFYVNATESPWSRHYHMYDYVSSELVRVVNDNLPVDPGRKSISGHSMGGHGALLVGIRNADQYRSVSAFAPICSASRSAWGRRALEAYLGPAEKSWLEYDASAVIRSSPSQHDLLVDQGAADPFLDQLRPADLQEACRAAGQRLTLRERAGYDHGYYFVGTFIEEHLKFHAAALA